LSSEITIDAADWFVTTDTVMGGVSTLSVQNSSNHLLFKGELSHENSGGFVSARIRDGVLSPPEQSKGIAVTWTGEDRSYRLVVHEQGRRTREYFSVQLHSSTQYIAWSELIYKFRRQQDPNRRIVPHQIASMGILLSDTHEGSVDFQLLSLNWWLS
jgi:hypothetical protein